MGVATLGVLRNCISAAILPRARHDTHYRDGDDQVQAVYKRSTVLSNTSQLKDQACTKRYGRFVHVM
jgi:hypothetical protein